MALRSSMFETNSSSCHTLVIGKWDNTIDISGITEEEIASGVINIYGDQYGCGHRELTTCKEKISYLFTDGLYAHQVYINDTHWTTRIITEEQANDINLMPDCLKLLVSTIKNKTGLDVHFCPSRDPMDMEPWGGIDHQSLGRAREHMTTEEDITMVIFNKNSYIELGNDNDYDLSYDEDRWYDPDDINNEEE